MSAGHVFISHGSDNRQRGERDFARSSKAAGSRPGSRRATSAPAWTIPSNCRARSSNASPSSCWSPRRRTHRLTSAPRRRWPFRNNKPIFPVRQSDIKPAAGPRLLPQDPPLDQRLRRQRRGQHGAARAGAADRWPGLPAEAAPLRAAGPAAEPVPPPPAPPPAAPSAAPSRRRRSPSRGRSRPAEDDLVRAWRRPACWSC